MNADPFEIEDEDSAISSVPPEFAQRSFGRYRLLRRMGHGGTASLFLAVDPIREPPSHLVALKQLHEHLSGDPNAQDAFSDEGRLATLLDHPCIVRALDAGIAEGRMYLTFEYLRGLDLGTLLAKLAARRERMPVAIACRIAIDLLGALDYAHRRRDKWGKPLGIVHRDVSPRNAFVTTAGITKLIDFGIAKARTRVIQTSTGVIKGRFSYIAPEQASGEEVDGRADLWSLGVVLWESMAGRTLFAGPTEFGSLTSSMLGTIPTLESVADVSPAMSRAIDRALQREPGDRWANAAEFRRAIEVASGADVASHEAVAQFIGTRFRDEIGFGEPNRVSIATEDHVAPAPVATNHSRIGRFLIAGLIVILAASAVITVVLR